MVGWENVAEIVSEADIIVNATPLGMSGENVLEDGRWHSDQVVCDLVYSPTVTPLMAQARAAGAEAWGGLGMLIHQAAMSFRIWTGTDPSLPTMSAAAVRAIGGGSEPPSL